MQAYNVARDTIEHMEKKINEFSGIIASLKPVSSKRKSERVEEERGAC